MSQDVVSDALNKIMNARKSGKSKISVEHHSKLLLSVLAIAKLKGYIKNYKLEDNSLNIEIGNITGCRAIKPRFFVKVDEVEKYVKRYLPANNLGIIIISTSKGLMTHQTAGDKGIGGSLIAFIY